MKEQINWLFSTSLQVLATFVGLLAAGFFFTHGRIEEELQKENAEYKYVRDSQLLDAPILKIVKRGEFEKYRARRVKEGANDSQFKVPELTSDPGFQNNFAIEEEICLN